jgi:transcription antitermination factor NusG
MNLADYTWHAIYSAPQRELITAHDLGTHGMQFIVPAEKHWVERRGRSRVTYKPVMPRYVFTGFRNVPNWERLRELVPTMQGYMQFGEGPTKMKLDDVRWLQDLSDQLRGREKPAVVEDVIKIGDQVRVIHGPFTGMSLRVSDIVADRIHALKTFLGAPRILPIPIAAVERV